MQAQKLPKSCAIIYCSIKWNFTIKLYILWTILTFHFLPLISFECNNGILVHVTEPPALTNIQYLKILNEGKLVVSFGLILFAGLGHGVGQHNYILLRQSEFKSCCNLHSFSIKSVFEKNNNKTKDGQGWPNFNNFFWPRNWVKWKLIPRRKTRYPLLIQFTIFLKFYQPGYVVHYLSSSYPMQN